jgi:hypothetical protein
MDNHQEEEETLTAQSNLTDVLAAVVAERARQDGKWGGAQVDDARKTPADWCLDIEAYNTWACQMYRMGSPDKYRRRMLQIAALAVAACESFDRQVANVKVRGCALLRSPS